MTTYANYEGLAWKLAREQKTFFDDMEKELGVPITVIAGHGQRTVRDQEKEGIVFFDYATNSDTPTPRRIDEISRRDGTKVKLSNGHLLKPDSREHIFDFNGFPLCEIRTNTLWGLTPLANFDSKDRMVEFFADAIRKSTDKEFFEQKEREKRDKIKNAFIKTMKAAQEAEVKQLAEEEKGLRDGVASLDQQLLTQYSQLHKTQKRLEILKQLQEGEVSYDDEISSILAHSHVKSIDFNTGNGMLEVYTTPLNIYSPDMTERAALGEFKIAINTKGNNRITLHNLTNKRSHKMHPHVEEDGTACWGTISSQIGTLAAAGKIEGLIDLCVRYLEGYNPADSYARYARLWFTEEETQTRREEFDGEWMTNKEYEEAKKERATKGKEEIKAAGEKDVVKPGKIEKASTLEEIKN